jgi:hypothetical protein
MYGNVVVEWMDVEADVWKIAWLTESGFPWFTRVTGLPLITNLIQSLMEILQFATQYSWLTVKWIQLCRKAVSGNAAVRLIVTGLKMVVVSTADLVSFLSSSSMSVRKWQLWNQALNILGIFFPNFLQENLSVIKRDLLAKNFIQFWIVPNRQQSTKRFDVGIPTRAVICSCFKLSISNLWKTIGVAVRSSIWPLPLSNTDIKYKEVLDHTQRRTTVGRTPLDQWSALRRDIYLTTHITHDRQTDIHAVGGIRANHLSRRAAAHLRLRPHGHWDGWTTYNTFCISQTPMQRHPI